jgi:hypothetical protein
MLSEPVLFCLIVALTCPRALAFVRFLVLGHAEALYKQVGTLLPGVRALRTLRLRAVRTTTAAESEESPSRLAV